MTKEKSTDMASARFVNLEIARGLRALKEIAHVDAMRRWGDMGVPQRCAIARALVLIEAAARNPAKYFSRAKTYGPWVTRAHAFMRRYEITDVNIAMDAVQNPAEYFVDRVGFVFADKYMSDIFSKFCNLVFLWEYEHLAHVGNNQTDTYSDSISFTVNVICEYQAQIKKKQSLAQMLKNIVRGR